MKTKKEILDYLHYELEYYTGFTIYCRKRLNDYDLNSNMYTIVSKTLVDTLIKVSTLKTILEFINEKEDK